MMAREALEIYLTVLCAVVLRLNLLMALSDSRPDNSQSPDPAADDAAAVDNTFGNAGAAAVTAATLNQTA
jgi:hypothetical protein